MAESCIILSDPTVLPDASLVAVDFRETTFFNESPDVQLSQPSIVRQMLIEKRSRPFTKNSPNDVVIFEDLGLIVKSGYRVKVEEALTLRMMNLPLADDVPTPEVFVWRVFEDIVFIYMALVPGTTLNAGFDSLNEDEKAVIAAQLSKIILSLRRLCQATEKPFLGSLVRGSLWDLYWRDDGGVGPFDSVKEFNDGVQSDAIPRLSYSHTQPLTHTTSWPIGPPGHRRLVCLFDWEQAGWYPEYWEYCKMIGVEHSKHGWLAEGWADKIMKPYENELLAWATYMLWRAP